VTATPLVIGPAELAALAALRERAAERPVDMLRLMRVIKTRRGKARHKAQMTEQSVDLPFGFAVTFSIETGHPIGTCRHLSMSSGAPGRVPSQEAVIMVGEPLGFIGDLDACCGVWLETLEGHGRALNIVQPVFVAAPPTRAQ
jgi:hypothetical protein